MLVSIRFVEITCKRRRELKKPKTLCNAMLSHVQLFKPLYGHLIVCLHCRLLSVINVFILFEHKALPLIQ